MEIKPHLFYQVVKIQGRPRPLGVLETYCQKISCSAYKCFFMKNMYIGDQDAFAVLH